MLEYPGYQGDRVADKALARGRAATTREWRPRVVMGPRAEFGQAGSVQFQIFPASRALRMHCYS